MKIRYIISTITIAAAVAITPYSIQTAYETRGYTAYGGEYLILPLALLLTWFMLDVMKQWDKLMLILKRTRSIKNIRTIHTCDLRETAEIGK